MMPDERGVYESSPALHVEARGMMYDSPRCVQLYDEILFLRVSCDCPSTQLSVILVPSLCLLLPG